MICSKCYVDKPIDQYGTYFHSTQQKFRTRKYCKTCYKIQKDKWKEKNKQELLERNNPDLKYLNNPEFKKCSSCLNWKQLKDFYKKNGKPLFTRCKECIKLEEREESLKKLEEQGGKLSIPQSPNTYFDNFQKNNTFTLMQLLGYLYDEPTGIWIKPGWKEIEDGKPYFPKLRKYNKTRRGVKLANELVTQIIELKQMGHNMVIIGKKLELSPSTVRKILIDNGIKTC